MKNSIEAKMGCNNMQPGMNKLNQSLLVQPEMSNCSSDSVLSHKHMTFSDTDVDILLADAGYSVKAADLAHVAQRLEQLESLCASQDAGVLSQLSSDVVHYNPSDLAGWIECMIGELGPPSLGAGDFSSTEGACGSVFAPQTPLHYALEDDYGDFNMGSCSMDQHSSSTAQFDTRPAYASPKPKQSAPTSMGIQASSASTVSISQLIKDAIGQHGGSSAANGPRYDAKDYSGMVLLNDEMGDFQQYKIVEDQASSNQMGSFYQRSVGDPSRQGPFSSGYSSVHAGIPRSSSMPTLQPQQHTTPMRGQQVHQQHRNHLQHLQHMQHHVRQPQKFKPNIGPLTSSQSSNVRSPYQNVPYHPQQHQLQTELSPEDIKVRANSISPSNSSPMMAYQEPSCGLHDTDSSYLHMQHMPDKLPHNQTHLQQEGVYVDVSDEGAQELGIRLVHLLMACAEAIPKNELAAALDMVREIKRLASSNSGAMGKVANYFVDALARRIYGASIGDWASLSQADALSEVLYSHFYEACPYLKFAHFMANQAILEAFKDHKFVHVIDFNLMQGSQWPALIQALALRPGGPPHLRMTGIGPPQPDNKDVLQEVGMKLAQIAVSVNVEFSFRGVVATKLDDVKPWMFEAKQGEAIAVNSILQLHRLLFGHVTSNPSMAPIDEVLTSIKSLSPKVVTLVEQEANHNSPVFLERFVEALHYYCTMFDSLEACCFPPQGPEMTYTEMYLAREIVNIVACEGLERSERHEPLSQWRKRMMNAGFQPLHLGSNAFKQASLLLKLSSGEGYTVEENKGCLTLGWHSRPLIAASAWQCG